MTSLRNFSAEELDAEWMAVNTLKVAAEQPVEEAMRQMFTAQRDRVLQRLQRGNFLYGRSARMRTDDLNVDTVFDLGAALDELYEYLDEPLAKALREGFDAGRFRISYEGSFNPGSETAQQALAEINAKARSIPQTTRSRINTVILRGKANDLSATEISTRIRQLFDGSGDGAAGVQREGMTQARARTIAETAGGGAFEAGQEEAWAQAGVAGSRWLSQRDSRVSEGHYEADGQEAAAGETFSVRRSFDKPFEELRWPKDPSGSASNVVRCRCTRLPLLELSEDG